VVPLRIEPRNTHPESSFPAKLKPVRSTFSKVSFSKLEALARRAEMDVSGEGIEPDYQRRSGP
jgi:hypothetical protein